MKRQINGIEYELKRSQRKTLALEITREAEVILRAPERMSMSRIEAFIVSNMEWINKNVQKRKEKMIPLPTAEQTETMKRQAKEIMNELVQYYGDIMGLKPRSIKITSAKKRFGSCNAKNDICFSYLLLCYPDEAIEYVVVHELAHIVHKNHGKEFYELIKKVMPDYKQRIKLLK